MKKSQNYNEKRNIGLDILRILSMFMILILHLLGKSGMLLKENNNQAYYLIYNLMEALSIVAVNCYVLISGYFLIKSEFKWKKVCTLWKETLFYSIFVFIATTIATKEFSLVLLIKSCFPILTREYWFINTYLLMYILSPFINKLIYALKKDELKKLIIILIIAFSIWSILPRQYIFDATAGYGIMWFVCLYIISAYVRLYLEEMQLKVSTYALIYIFTALCITILMVILDKVALATGKDTLKGKFLEYNNFLVLIESLSLFMAFRNLKIEKKSFIKTIEFVSPLTLAVYLIHEQYGLSNILYYNILNMTKCYNNNYSIFIIIGYAILIFTICIFIEYIRKTVFNFVKRKELNEKK